MCVCIRIYIYIYIYIGCVRACQVDRIYYPLYRKVQRIGTVDNLYLPQVSCCFKRLPEVSLEGSWESMAVASGSWCLST